MRKSILFVLFLMVITKSPIDTTKNWRMYTVAVSKHDKDFCNYIDNYDIFYYCKASVSKSVYECYRIKDEDLKNNCVGVLSSFHECHQSKDENLKIAYLEILKSFYCAIITDRDLRYHCYGKSSSSNKHHLCNNIENSLLKDDCLTSFNDGLTSFNVS